MTDKRYYFRLNDEGKIYFYVPHICRVLTPVEVETIEFLARIFEEKGHSHTIRFAEVDTLYEAQLVIFDQDKLKEGPLWKAFHDRYEHQRLVMAS